MLFLNWMEWAISYKHTKAHNSFLSKLSKDARNINASTSLLIPADKTTNLYKVKTVDHDQLLQDNVRAKYKKTDSSSVGHTNLEAKSIPNSLKLGDRIEKIAKKNAFVPLKDHTPNFINNCKCHLINPTKSKIGINSKQLLDQINNTIRFKTELKKWRN